MASKACWKKSGKIELVPDFGPHSKEKNIPAAILQLMSNPLPVT